MSLHLDEFTAAAPKILLTPPTRSVRLLTGNEPKTEGETMPRGVYERKPRATKVAPAEKPAPVARKALRATKKHPEGNGLRAKRKAQQAPADGPRFGVFEDGTIELKLPSCTGVVGTDDARALVGFLRKIGIDA